MSDGWEYWSAKDLNIKAVPYPGKRPSRTRSTRRTAAAPGSTFSAIDFDGDGLTTLEEYRAWRYTGSGFDLGQGRRRWTSSPPSATATARSSAARATSRASRPGAPPASASRPRRSRSRRPMTCTATRRVPGRRARRGRRRPRELPRGRARPGQRQLVGRLLEGRGPPDRAVGSRSYCGQRPGAFNQRPFADLDLADSGRRRRHAARRRGRPGQRTTTTTSPRSTRSSTTSTATARWVSTRPGAASPPASIPSIDLGGGGHGGERLQPLRPDTSSRTLPDAQALLSSPLPAVPPPTWRPHPRL